MFFRVTSDPHLISALWRILCPRRQRECPDSTKDEETNSIEALAASRVDRSGKSSGRLLNCLWSMGDNVLWVVFRGVDASEWSARASTTNLLAATGWRYSSPRSGRLLRCIFVASDRRGTCMR